MSQQTDLTAATQWRYKVDGTAPEANWYKDEFSGSWPTATQSALPTPSSISAYYCATFDVLEIQGYAAIQASVRTRGGYALYLNGQEMTRIRLPTGDLTYQTESTAEETSMSLWVALVSFELAAMRNTGNLICVEIHTKTPPTENEFAIVLSLEGSETDLTTNGVVTASHPGFDDGYYHETYDNTVDKNTNTKFYAESTAFCQGSQHVWVSYTFNNNRKVFSNQFTLYSGNNYNRRPYTVQVKGLNDNNEYELIQSFQTQGTWGATGVPTQKMFAFDNSKAYSAYRIEYWGCESEGVEMSEWYIQTRVTAAYCTAQDGYSASFVGSKAMKACPTEGYIGGLYRTCQEGGVLSSEIEDTCIPPSPSSISYGNDNKLTIPVDKEVSFTPTALGNPVSWSVNTSLPSGLFLDSQSGTIYGMVQQTFSDLVFEITATNDYGSGSVSVTISAVIVNCEATEKYPYTAHKAWSVVNCPTYYSGYARVQCIAGDFSELDLTNCDLRASSFFSYGVSEVIYKTGVEIEPLTLLYNAVFENITITPALPEGLTFSETGVLSGKPTQVSEQLTYTITGTNILESVETTLQITVLDNGCNALDSFPAVSNWETSSSSTFCPEGYEGTVTRLCTNGVFGEPDYTGCTALSPSGFSYQPASVTVAMGGAVYMKPTYTNIVTQFVVNPSLPEGLILTESGDIAGMASVLGTNTYTITATNTLSTPATTEVTITVTSIGCNGVEGIDIADQEVYTEACPEGYIGQATRTCSNGVLSALDRSGCRREAPSNLHYVESEIVGVVNNLVQTPRPEYNGTISSFTISPELPTGLMMQKDGSISGYPTQESDRTAYHIIGQGEDDNTVETDIYVTVKKQFCVEMEDVPETPVGTNYTMDCTTIAGYKGTSVRACILDETGLAGVWSAPYSFCVESKFNVILLVGILLIVLGVVMLVVGIVAMVNRSSRKVLPKVSTAQAPASAPASLHRGS